MRYIIIIILFVSCNNTGEKSKLNNFKKEVVNDSLINRLNCNIPNRIKNYLDKEQIKIYLEKDLGDWKISQNLDSINCPTMIAFDITKDGEEDFICIIEYNYAEIGEEAWYLPAVVIFKNYKTSTNLILEKICPAKGSLEDGLGTLIHLCDQEGEKRKSICVINLESSASYVYYEKGVFKEKYFVD